MGTAASKTAGQFLVPALAGRLQMAAGVSRTCVLAGFAAMSFAQPQPTNPYFMNSTSQINVFLRMMEVQLPTLIVCVVACVVIMTRWRPGSRALLFALLGFGLTLALCILIPVVQMLLQPWVFQNNSGYNAERMWVYSITSILWSVLHGVAYVFLLLAVLAGCAPSGSTRPGKLP
jgi:hypothetical protein